jgi:hypothetical protein
VGISTITHNSIRSKVRESISEAKPLVLTTNNLLRDIEDHLFVFFKVLLRRVTAFPL